MQALARFFSWLGGIIDDLDEWGNTQRSWRDIREDRADVEAALRAFRDWPPAVGLPDVDTSDRPFGLPPDVEATESR